MHVPIAALDACQQLALLLRVLAAHDYDDKLAGHVSLRDRDDETLLVTPLGHFWRDIRASHMMRVDLDGKVIEGAGDLNPTIIFHCELHRARPDIRVAVHNHPRYACIWAAAGELPPLLDQQGANGGGRAVLYTEFEGAVLTQQIARELAHGYGSADMAILAQHGVLVTADEVGTVLARALAFEWRCRVAYEVACMGKSGVPLTEANATQLGQYAAQYGHLLLEAYGREQIARDPSLLD